jgi:hypothetical protein
VPTYGGGAGGVGGVGGVASAGFLKNTLPTTAFVADELDLFADPPPVGIFIIPFVIS